jgi:hypothetical protein
MQGFVLWCYSVGYARTYWNKPTSILSVETATPAIRGSCFYFSANPNLSNTVSWALFCRVHRQYVWEWRRSRNTQYGSICSIPLRVTTYGLLAACALVAPLALHSVRQNTCALQCDVNSSSAKVFKYSYNSLQCSLASNKSVLCRLSSHAGMHMFTWWELNRTSFCV